MVAVILPPWRSSVVAPLDSDPGGEGTRPALLVVATRTGVGGSIAKAIVSRIAGNWWHVESTSGSRVLHWHMVRPWRTNSMLVGSVVLSEGENSVFERSYLDN